MFQNIKKQFLSLKKQYQNVLNLGESIINNPSAVHKLTNERHRLLNRICLETKNCKELWLKHSENFPSFESAQIEEIKKQIFDMAPLLNHQQSRMHQNLNIELKATRKQMIGERQKSTAIKAYSNFQRNYIF
jgi:hypothetical protein